MLVAGMVALFVAATAAGCGSDDAEKPASQGGVVTYVGKVESTDAFIAVVSDGQNVKAYLCDNGVTYEDWFRGPLSDGKAEIESEGVRLAVRLQSDGATGTVTGVDGMKRDFATKPAKGDAGLYRTLPDDKLYDGAWIVLNDGGGFRGSLMGLETLMELEKKRLETQQQPSTGGSGGSGGGGTPTGTVKTTSGNTIQVTRVNATT